MSDPTPDPKCIKCGHRRTCPPFGPCFCFYPKNPGARCWEGCCEFYEDYDVKA